MTWHCFLWKRHTSSLGFRLFSEMFRFLSRLWISGLHTLHTVCFPHQWTESFRILYDFWRCSTLRQSAWDYRRKQWSNTYTIRGRHFHPWYHDQNCKYAPVINHSYSFLQIYHYASHPLRRIHCRGKHVYVATSNPPIPLWVPTIQLLSNFTCPLLLWKRVDVFDGTPPCQRVPLWALRWAAGTLLVLALTAHVTWHRGTLKVRVIGVLLSTSTCIFHSDILCHFHINFEEALMVTNWTAGEHACFIRMGLCSRNRRLPGVQETFTAAEKGRHVEMCRDQWFSSTVLTAFVYYVEDYHNVVTSSNCITKALSAVLMCSNSSNCT